MESSCERGESRGEKRVEKNSVWREAQQALSVETHQA
jgi:hypothetical protein